jgi:hypothetical protein
MQSAHSNQHAYRGINGLWWYLGPTYQQRAYGETKAVSDLRMETIGREAGLPIASAHRAVARRAAKPKRLPPFEPPLSSGKMKRLPPFWKAPRLPPFLQLPSLRPFREFPMIRSSQRRQPQTPHRGLSSSCRRPTPRLPARSLIPHLLSMIRMLLMPAFLLPSRRPPLPPCSGNRKPTTEICLFPSALDIPALGDLLPMTRGWCREPARTGPRRPWMPDFGNPGRYLVQQADRCMLMFFDFLGKRSLLPSAYCLVTPRPAAPPPAGAMPASPGVWSGAVSSLPVPGRRTWEPQWRS